MRSGQPWKPSGGAGVPQVLLPGPRVFPRQPLLEFSVPHRSSSVPTTPTGHCHRNEACRVGIRQFRDWVTTNRATATSGIKVRHASSAHKRGSPQPNLSAAAPMFTRKPRPDPSKDAWSQFHAAVGVNPKKCGSTNHQNEPENRPWRYNNEGPPEWQLRGDNFS